MLTVPRTLTPLPTSLLNLPNSHLLKASKHAKTANSCAGSAHGKPHLCDLCVTNSFFSSKLVRIHTAKKTLSERPEFNYISLPLNYSSSRKTSPFLRSRSPHRSCQHLGANFSKANRKSARYRAWKLFTSQQDP